MVLLSLVFLVGEMKRVWIITTVIVVTIACFLHLCTQPPYLFFEGIWGFPYYLRKLMRKVSYPKSPQPKVANIGREVFYQVEENEKKVELFLEFNPCPRIVQHETEYAKHHP